MFYKLTKKIQEGSEESPRWVLKICNSSDIYAGTLPLKEKLGKGMGK